MFVCKHICIYLCMSVCQSGPFPAHWGVRPRLINCADMVILKKLDIASNMENEIINIKFNRIFVYLKFVFPISLEKGQVCVINGHCSKIHLIVCVLKVASASVTG